MADSREAARSVAERFYASLYGDRAERSAVRGLAGADLAAEIALLRVLIRRAVAEGADLETVSRACGRLAQMLRVQRALSGEAARSLDEALAKVLEEISTEVGL